MKHVFLVVLIWVALPAQSASPDRICSSGTHGPVECVRKAHYAHDICNAIEVFARHHGLQPDFFARLVWQESRFDPNAISPVGAQGIAQFMPYTARRLGLGDSFNPVEALEFSAHYLSEMKEKFGNIGLAAIGYNGGERRAEGVIAGTGGLMQETVDYVRIITGVPYQNWTEQPEPDPDLRLDKDLPFDKACHQLARTHRMTKLKPIAPAVKPWGIQMAFGLTKSSARKKFASKTRACASLINGQAPDLVFEKSRASPKGGYFMARLGRNSRDQAWRDCAKMKKLGCICAVYSNE